MVHVAHAPLCSTVHEECRGVGPASPDSRAAEYNITGYLNSRMFQSNLHIVTKVKEMSCSLHYGFDTNDVF